MPLRNLAGAALAGALLWLAIVLLIVAWHHDECIYVANHSGVVECHVGPYTGPMPVDTTNGRDIQL
jgi:hypothetical protein